METGSWIHISTPGLRPGRADRPANGFCNGSGKACPGRAALSTERHLSASGSHSDLAQDERRYWGIQTLIHKTLTIIFTPFI